MDFKLFEGLDPVETKKCNQCHKLLPITSFSFNSGASHRRAKCRDCENKFLQQRRKYKHLKPPLNHVCPICQKAEEECTGKGGKKARTWCLDHDHNTGSMRGWLCHECNRALGNFKDNIEILERALKYLNGELNDDDKDEDPYELLFGKVK